MPDQSTSVTGSGAATVPRAVDTAELVGRPYLQWVRTLGPAACAVAFLAGWLAVGSDYLLGVAVGCAISLLLGLAYLLLAARMPFPTVLGWSLALDVVVVAGLVAQVPDPALASLAFVWNLGLATALLAARPALAISTAAIVASAVVSASGGSSPAEVVTSAVILAVVAAALSLVRARERHAFAVVTRVARLLAETERIARVGSWTWDVETGDIAWSDEMYRLFNLPVGTPISNETFLAHVSSPSERARIGRGREQVAQDGDYDVEMALDLPDGTRRLLHVTGEMAVDADGRRAMHGTAQDITGAHRVNRLREEFVAMASHELRTPVTVVLGFAETMQERWDEIADADKRTYVGLMAEAAGHLSRLVEDVLLASRVEAGVPTLESARVHLAEEVASHAASLPDLLLELHVDDAAQAACVLADPVRLRQVIANLVGNAERHGGDAPIVVEVAVDESSAEAVVRVRDQGPGIEPTDQQRIFERFVRVGASGRSTNGTGLGLFISRQLVEAMGGRIWVESTVGQGATFSFALPLCT